MYNFKLSFGNSFLIFFSDKWKIMSDPSFLCTHLKRYCVRGLISFIYIFKYPTVKVQEKGMSY